jgi:hypothetical protein
LATAQREVSKGQLQPKTPDPELKFGNEAMIHHYLDLFQRVVVIFMLGAP